MEASMIRKRARSNLAGNWGLSVGVAVVASLLGGLIISGSFLPSLNEEVSASFPWLKELAETLNRGIQIGNVTFSFRSGIFGFAAFLIGGVLQLGYAQFLLKQHDGQDTEFNDLFSQFDRFGAGFAQQFLRNLYVALWSLLFIIPGIIKSYGYAMTPFLMADNHNLSASEAIDLSQQIMDGHKMDLFILELTFLGWDLLAALTLNLGNIFLNPYKNAAYAAFYRQLLAENQYTTVE